MARRSNGEGSFYQQKDKSWVYQVTYGRKEDGSPYAACFDLLQSKLCRQDCPPGKSIRDCWTSALIVPINGQCLL